MPRAAWPGAAGTSGQGRLHRRPPEDIVEHCRCHPARERVLLAGVVAADEQDLASAGAAAGVPAAILSRGIAGLAGRTLIVNLPGSTGGVRDGMAVLSPVLGHAIDQAHGGDHVASRDT